MLKKSLFCLQMTAWNCCLMMAMVLSTRCVFPGFLLETNILKSLDAWLLATLVEQVGNSKCNDLLPFVISWSWIDLQTGCMFLETMRAIKLKQFWKKYKLESMAEKKRSCNLRFRCPYTPIFKRSVLATLLCLVKRSWDWYQEIFETLLKCSERPRKSSDISR